MSSSHFASTTHQEQFGHAFLGAISALAGCWISVPKPDAYKTDVKIGTHFAATRAVKILDPELAIQSKTTASIIAETATHFSFKIDRKTYNYLREKRVGIPRLLVIVRIASDPTAPLSQSQSQTIMLEAPFWLHIKGSPSLPLRQNSTTVHVAKANLLTPTALLDLLDKAARKVL